MVAHCCRFATTVGESRPNLGQFLWGFCNAYPRPFSGPFRLVDRGLRPSPADYYDSHRTAAAEVAAPSGFTAEVRSVVLWELSANVTPPADLAAGASFGRSMKARAFVHGLI